MMKVKANAFDALNPAQRRAATFGTVVPEKGVSAGPLLILAGAGTGKTNTLAHRAAHLVLNGSDPSRIMMLTFTRRAAQEMIKRTQTIVAEVLADRGKGGDRSVVSRLTWSGTFHSVGSRILRLYAKHLGLDPNFTVLDRSDAADLMDVIRTELGYSGRPKRFPRKDTCLAIYSYRVNTRLSLKQTLEEQFPWCLEWEADLTKLYREYVGRKQKNRGLDFDDLLLYWHVMMQTPALAQSLSKNFDHVLVDEYQDTSSLQGDIVHALKPDGKGITVVGDDAQAIYSFRAAAVENILGFADRYKPKADVVVLAQNYRSTQQVLDSANALMADGARQHRKTLLGMRQSPQKPFYVALDDAQAQAEYISGKILHTREIGGSLEAACDSVPQLPSQRCAGSRTRQEEHPLREIRRTEIPGSGARQGHDVGAALGRQSAQRGGGISRAEAASRLRTRRTPSRRWSISRRAASRSKPWPTSMRRSRSKWTGSDSAPCSRSSPIRPLRGRGRWAW